MENKTNNDLFYEDRNSFVNVFHNMKLKYCGKELCTQGFAYGPCVRNEYLIHIVLSGKGELFLNGQVMNVEAGGAFLICPGQEASYKADKIEPWTYVWIGFSGNCIDSFLDKMGFNDKNPVIYLKDTKGIEEKILELLQWQSTSMSCELKRQSCFYSVLAYSIDESKNYKEESSDTSKLESLYVSKAIEMIMQNYDKKIKVTDIANYIGINRSYLTNLFKKEMGLSPQNYIIDFRLEKAAQMLKRTNDSMLDIALEVGYSDSLAFSKAFKQKFGVSPSSYRKDKN